MAQARHIEFLGAKGGKRSRLGLENPERCRVLTLHLLPTSAMKVLSEPVEEEPSLTFATRLTVSRYLNPMDNVVSVSSVSFVIVREVGSSMDPVEPIAPSTTFRSPLRCLIVASRLALDNGVQLTSSFSRLFPASHSPRTRYL